MCELRVDYFSWSYSSFSQKMICVNEKSWRVGWEWEVALSGDDRCLFGASFLSSTIDSVVPVFGEYLAIGE